ncbi:Leucine-rich repeat-containing protein 15 [Trichinella pseudospiralis]|uniref:Leucine-rich repeat-containing protein 15 n=2 Tax=Trichinella pseudospiralis TaxID=6337 RepID=A0A0V1FI28_TRIPS|nr:Leucine-rich repeat-containing protein 15 [Trichinella pseudospiralis]
MVKANIDAWSAWLTNQQHRQHQQYLNCCPLFSPPLTAHSNNEECPIRTPCFCMQRDQINEESLKNATRPILVTCNQAGQLSDVLTALAVMRGSNLPLQSVHIVGIRATNMPAHAFDGLDITELAIRRAGLKTLHQSTFDHTLLETLITLDLSDNELESVPTNALAKLRQLRRLRLSNNRIGQLPMDTFVGFLSRSRIHSLNLAGNSMTNFAALATAALDQLEQLSLENNNLTEIPYQCLSRHRATLNNLNLASNQISSLKPNSFDLPQLRSLSLENNPIHELGIHGFTGLPHLLHLYISGTRLHSFEAEAFCPIYDLNYLSIGATAIVQLPAQALRCLKNLLRLEMTNGILKTIETGVFQLAPNLRAIILANNRLKTIDQNTFAGLDHVYSIDLSRNQLQSVANFAFSSLKSLRHLDLSYNALQTLQPNTFEFSFNPELVDMNVIYLCGNYWKCDVQLDWFRRWLREHIDVVVDRPDCPAVCSEPPQLRAWPVRFLNPPPEIAGGEYSPGFLPPTMEPDDSELAESIQRSYNPRSPYRQPASSVLQMITGTVPRVLKRVYQSQ